MQLTIQGFEIGTVTDPPELHPDIYYCPERRHLLGHRGQRGISDALLHSLDPSINGGCTYIQSGQLLCLGGGRGDSERTQTYTDTCLGIEAATGCTNLGIGQVLCVTGETSGGRGGPYSDNGIDGDNTINVVVVQDLCPGCQDANGIDQESSTWAGPFRRCLNQLPSTLDTFFTTPSSMTWMGWDFQRIHMEADHSPADACFLH
ncbi:hypothetical protein B0H19DRAFT_1069703 [Mycena capillaripes]|nr:hypothetical protein B0H19DRAFT_1069703 [Mycena capillaripes]